MGLNSGFKGLSTKVTMKSELERLAVYFTTPYNLLKSCLCGVTFLKDD